ncbi:MAG: hypothetical protein OEM59_20905 [Rhodospirillales bacterium]|nr:hypothetical protein [Rhodospirillales bacterium]
MRNLAITTIVAAAIASTLALTAAAQPAHAGKVCKKLNLRNNCIVSSDVKNNNLTATDIRDEAGADFDGGDQTLDLTGAQQVIRSVTLVAPRPGVVLVNASGTFWFLAGSQIAVCGITTGSAVDGESLVVAENDDLISYTPFAATRAFQVPAGSFTVNLVCYEAAGSSTRVLKTHLNALYVPTRY